MKVNSKTTKDDNAAANLICHQGGQRTVNGIIGNTRRGIQVDQTLDPDSNNPVANKPVSAALAALAGELAKGQVVFLDQLPESGEPHKVYVLTATNQRYLWDGSKFVKIVPTESASANIISNDMVHYTAEEGKVYDKLVFPNGDKYAQYFPLEGDVGTSYYYRAKRVDFSENEDEPDKISLSYIKFLLDGGKIKRSSVDADLPKYEAFEGVQTKANNSLQKPEIAPTKTKLVGVGTNGQENIEIGDNLTLANGKLSATGGGSGGDSFDTIVLSGDETTYTGTITGERPVLIETTGTTILPVQNYVSDMAFAFAYELGDGDSLYLNLYLLGGGQVQNSKFKLFATYYSHFITMTDSTNNVALYLTIQNNNVTEFTFDTLFSYFSGKKVLANGNLHGSVPTYITQEGGSVKIYYMNPGDNNIDVQPDEYQSLSSFTITDLVTPVE